MKERISFQQLYKIQPALHQGLGALEKAAEASSLEARLRYLLKLRASQLNHCAFCQHMHSEECRKHDEQQERLDVLAAWREAPCFNARERAALNWCEQITLLPQGVPTSEAFETLSAVFSEQEIVDLTMVIVAINGWNRIATAMGFVPKMSV